MLNQSRVLDYIKMNLGFPYNPLELEDHEIIKYISEYSLREFSHYMPDVSKMVLNVQDPCTKVPLVQNEFYLTDPDNLEILNVIDLIWSRSNLIFTGHPITGAFSQGDLPQFFLSVEQSMQTKLYSMFDYTFEFFSPNRLRISPVIHSEDSCIVEYERMHKTDLSTIQNEFQYIYMQFCLSDIQIMLGTMRRRYGGNIRTPFGEIPVDTEILNDGKELKNSIIQKLESSCLAMNVIFEKG